MSYKEAAEVCFSRRMELFSADPVIEEKQNVFGPKWQKSRFYEAGESKNLRRDFRSKLNLICSRSKPNVDFCRRAMLFSVEQKRKQDQMRRC